MSSPLPTADGAERRRRIGWSVAGGAVGLALAVGVGGYAWRAALLQVTATTTSYTIVDDRSVTVGFDVSRPPEQPVTCTIRALDGRFGVVGSVDAAVPPGGERVVHQEVTVRTTSRAVTGVVQDCVRT